MSSPSAPPTFEVLLTTTAWWLLAGCGCWAALICLAALVEAGSGGRLRATVWVGCPPALRRTLLTVIGVVLVVDPGSASASAVTSAATSGIAARSRHPAYEEALPVPERPLGPAGDARRIVVRPGDNLWRLAAARLPPTARAAEVCAQVERLYRRNRDLIGPDPDLIRPGQHLVVPHPVSS